MKSTLLATLVAPVWGWFRPDADHPASVLGGRDTVGSHPFAKFKVLGPDLAPNEAPAPLNAAVDAPPLECFQVAEPVLAPGGPSFSDSSAEKAFRDSVGPGTAFEPACDVLLMNHTFANSYGAPFVGNYTPPDCDFNHVVINFTVLVKGRQYDRTGVMYLGDTEVWRTSTAEPTPSGIRWTWQKDMTPFLSLWKNPQTVIFDLENIVNDIYTGPLDTTLTATFFKLSFSRGSHQAPADLILPITRQTGSEGKPSQFTYPEQDPTVEVAFPRNVNRAVFSVDVKGQGDEEFWWSNVPQSAIHTFEDSYGKYPGYSAWREVQVLIDGQLAGVSWPYPVIYTGGVVPHLHRPIVGIQAFDIREEQIDITPWLPLLCDGGVHAFSIRVVGLEDDGSSNATLSSTTDSSWYVTGKIFLWLDEEGSVTTGVLGSATRTNPTISLSQQITQNATGGNETLSYDISVSREFSISSVVETQQGKGTARWSQSLRYTNVGSVFSYGYDNLNTFAIEGSAEAEAPGIYYSTSYDYPLFCNSTSMYSPEGNLTLWAQLDQGLDLTVLGNSVFPKGVEAFVTGFDAALGAVFQGSQIKTWRNSTADYYRPADNSYSKGVGTTYQDFLFGGLSGVKSGGVEGSSQYTQLYRRVVQAHNDTVVADHVEF